MIWNKCILNFKEIIKLVPSLVFEVLRLFVSRIVASCAYQCFDGTTGHRDRSSPDSCM